MTDESKDILEACFEYIDTKFENIHNRDYEQIKKIINEELDLKLKYLLNEIAEVLDLMYANLKK